MILGKYHIMMSDTGDKNWDSRNLHLMYISLGNINNVLDNQFRSLTGFASFTLRNQDPSGGQYHGSTLLDGSGIQFYTLGQNPIRQINIYHEVGHLLDNTSGLRDIFTNAVENLNNPSWVEDDMQITPYALNSRYIYNDPNYPWVEARQTYIGFGPSEQWSDAFANYIGGNINLCNSEGISMFNFIRGALQPYLAFLP